MNVNKSSANHPNGPAKSHAKFQLTTCVHAKLMEMFSKNTLPCRKSFYYLRGLNDDQFSRWHHCKLVGLFNVALTTATGSSHKKVMHKIYSFHIELLFCLLN